MSEPTYLVLGVDLRDHIITQQVKTTLLAVSLLTVFTAQTSLFHENCVSRFKLTPQPTIEPTSSSRVLCACGCFASSCPLHGCMLLHLRSIALSPPDLTGLIRAGLPEAGV